MDNLQLVDRETLVAALRDSQPKAPTPTNGFDWAYAEKIGVTVPATNIVSLPMVVGRTKRKIYAYIGTTAADAADYYVNAVLQFFLNNSLVGTLPLGDAVSPIGSVRLTDSLASIFVGGGNVVADSIAVNLSKRSTTIVLQPQYITIKADELRISILSAYNITSVNFYLAAFSSEL